MNRRNFLLSTLLTMPLLTEAIQNKPLNRDGLLNTKKPAFKLALAPWSLMRKPAGQEDLKGIPLMDYPMVARELGFMAIEQDNLHFPGELPNESLLNKMKKRTDEAGVLNSLLLCGALGDIADVDKKKRKEAISKYKSWLEGAKSLGCTQMRIVCADRITIPREEKMKYAVEGVSIMADFAKDHSMELLIENHNGYSSDPEWLVQMIKAVNMDNCGILGDFTEWRMEHDPLTLYPDPYKGYKILAPYIRAVGAKSVDFNADGEEINVSFSKMLQILTEVDYNGYITVEYFGEDRSRRDGITLTKNLIEDFINTYQD